MAKIHKPRPFASTTAAILIFNTFFLLSAKADWDPGDISGSAKRLIEATLRDKKCLLKNNPYVVEVVQSKIYDVKLDYSVISEQCLKALAAARDPRVQVIIPGPSAVIRLKVEYSPPNPDPSPGKYLSLSWENTDKPHPERVEWSLVLSQQIDKHFDAFNSSNDITFFCPPYESLNRKQRIKAIAEIFVWLAYYESGFDPLSFGPDVATKNHPRDFEKYPEEWSVGLYQMSVIDQNSYGLSLGLVFDPTKYPDGTTLSELPTNDLRQPLHNIILATEVMAKMLLKHGKLRVGSGAYWSTLQPSGAHDKLYLIKEHILKYNSICGHLAN